MFAPLSCASDVTTLSLFSGSSSSSRKQHRHQPHLPLRRRGHRRHLHQRPWPDTPTPKELLDLIVRDYVRQSSNAQDAEAAEMSMLAKIDIATTGWPTVVEQIERGMIILHVRLPQQEKAARSAFMQLFQGGQQPPLFVASKPHSQAVDLASRDHLSGPDTTARYM